MTQFQLLADSPYLFWDCPKLDGGAALAGAFFGREPWLFQIPLEGSFRPFRKDCGNIQKEECLVPLYFRFNTAPLQSTVQEGKFPL